MRAASSLCSARSARRLYVAATVSRSSRAGLTTRSVAAAARTERRMSSLTTTATAATAFSSSSTAATAAASASSYPPTAAAFSLYSQPRLYDAAFAFRDFDAEAMFIVDAWKTYGEEGEAEGEGSGKYLSSFLDVGAGTGRHGAALAKISSSPLSLFALDTSAEMLSAAARAAEEAGCPLKQAIRADMTAGPFEISEKVQVALCALGTLAHALPPPSPSSDSDSDSDPALEALRAVSSALVPGGILILELPAAGDLFDGTLLVGDAWDVPAGEWQRDGGSGEEGKQRAEKAEPRKRKIGQITKPQSALPSSPSPALIVEYGSPDDDFDPVSQVLQRTVVVSEARDDGSAGKEVGRETVAQRLFTPGEIRSLAREAGFRVAAELGDMELGGEEGTPSAQEGDRYVAVLVKRNK